MLEILLLVITGFIGINTIIVNRDIVILNNVIKSCIKKCGVGCSVICIKKKESNESIYR